MRLFTAVELPDEVRAAVAAAAGLVLGPLEGARPVGPENLHVTVRFLGEVAPPALGALRAALADAAAASPSSTSRVRGFGAFPSSRDPRVIWAGVDDPSHALAVLERNVTERIAPLGFPPEDRPWSPHVTVARVGGPRRRRPGRRAPGAANFAPPPAEPLGPDFAVRELALLESEITPRGSRYRVLARFPLAASPEPGPTGSRPGAIPPTSPPLPTNGASP